MSDTETKLPGAALEADRMPGHWLLARLGKTVLRPGGRELTESLLGSLAVGPADDVLEVAPGLGSTTRLVLDRHPASYVGVDRDPDAAERVGALAGAAEARVVHGTAATTGLSEASVSVAFGEAYLTMQPDRLKGEILAELARVVAPGGRLGLHEMALSPEGISEEMARTVSADLKASIKVPVAPLPLDGWRQLVEEAGFVVDTVATAPLHLLEPRRLVADEGASGAARFVGRVVRDSAARRRVWTMRAAMRRHRDHLQAFAMTATRRT